jgi:23S rRNA (uracil1939-C5)-methyltransferase
MNKFKKFNILESISVSDYAAEGKSIARVDNYVIFIQNAIPGDILDIKLQKIKSNYAEASIEKVVKPSEFRKDAFCAHFGICGGCKWQHLDYSKQAEFKQQQVKDQLEKLGGMALPEITAILPSSETQFYRNKLEFTFSNKRWFTNNEINNQPTTVDALGFHVPGRFDKIVDVEKCYLQDDLSNQIRNSVREYGLKNQLQFFDLKKQEGFLRNLIIRNSSVNEWMVIVVFYYEDKQAIELLMDFLKTKFPFITSLNYVVNPKKNDTIHDLEVVLYHGKSFIMEKMEDVSFQIGPKTFYQTNSKQAYELYKITRDYADLKGDEIVYDLYTGAGTIANFVAKNAKKVVGVEYVASAIEDAKLNSALNNIENTVFYAGDMKDVLTSAFIAENGKPDVIITDPPRAGMHEDVVKRIIEASPEKIVYVSCNPATQARDLQLLDSHYSVEKVQPVDMFPHTHHVENVVLLRKR